MKRNSEIEKSKRNRFLFIVGAVIILSVIVGATSYQYFASIKTTAVVEECVFLNGQNYSTPIIADFDVPAGGDVNTTYTLENTGDKPISVYMNVTAIPDLDGITVVMYDVSTEALIANPFVLDSGIMAFNLSYSFDMIVGTYEIEVTFEYA